MKPFSVASVALLGLALGSLPVVGAHADDTQVHKHPTTHHYKSSATPAQAPKRAEMGQNPRPGAGESTSGTPGPMPDTGSYPPTNSPSSPAGH